MTTDQTPTSATMNEIKELQEYFVTSLAQLQAGNIVNMQGIDKRISAICNTAQRSSPEEQQLYLPELTFLINLLNSYESELRRLQSMLADESAKGSGNGESN